MYPQLVIAAAIFALIFVYLGLSLLTSLTLAFSWVLLGAAGGWLIQASVGEVRSHQRLPLSLGPGALLGLTLAVFAYLSVRGGVIGIALVIGVILLGTRMWLGSKLSDNSALPTNMSALLMMLGVAGSALLANSKEFPNLLVPSIGVLLVASVWSLSNRTSWRAGSLIVAAASLIYELYTRPSYWWWSSDDTTTLSGIGTIIIKRGRVADVAGWSTGSHHWLLHAWLALWNQLSSGQIFETHLIAWPIVAAISLFASLWLCIDLFFGRYVPSSIYIFAAIVTAGLVQLEWPAPQEQQPFVFGFVACSALWLCKPRRSQTQQPWQIVCGITLVFVVVPASLIVLKPSLLVAYGLIIVGTVLVRLGMTRGRGLVLAFAASFGAIAAGIALMKLGASWVSRRSFTTFGIDWFPDDLGWCRYASKPGSLACVLSLQIVLFTGALLAGCVLWMRRATTNLRVSPVVLLPLMLAYLPLRYLVSSDVGSGAPSFYRLSEMTLTIFVALGVAATLIQGDIRTRWTPALVALIVVIAAISEGPSSAYDTVDRMLVSFSLLRYLNASDVISLSLAFIAAVVLVRLRLFGNSRSHYIVVCLLLVSVLPIGRAVFVSATSENDPVRNSRPADFGPPDIEQVGSWLKDKTDFGTLLATNFLCPTDRLDECTRTTPETSCARYHPSLMASWALAALSEREFLYLSQGWDSNTVYYFIHQRSIRLGVDVSTASVRELQDLGVSYYVASIQHTNPRVWPVLQASAEFQTENFVVVSLETLATPAT